MRAASTTWKTILDNRYLLSKENTWILGNGQNIKSWYDHWMEFLFINKTKLNT